MAEPLQTVAPSCRTMSPLTPRSLSHTARKTNCAVESSRSGQENTQPSHPNVQLLRPSSISDPKKLSKQIAAPLAGKNPSFVGSTDESPPPSDDSVKVVVRIRPELDKGGPHVVRRIASDTLSAGDRKYSFDSILDSGSSQSGTGKTYTMWGPPSAMVDGPCINSLQGIVPRIFQMLFSEIIKIRDDASNPFQVENLSEDNVNNIEDITQLLVKGLSSNFFSSSKTSRINFVDLAGIGNCILDGLGRQSIQEEQFIKKSLSKLGCGETDDHLFNKHGRYKAITLSTLRLGGRARKMKNTATINEISEDDVNDLSNQIRQLKEELIRAKSCGSSHFVSTDGYSKWPNTRENLNNLRRSLNRSLFLPSVGNDPEVDMDVDEEDVRELWVQLNDLHSSVEEQDKDFTAKDSVHTLLSDGMIDAEIDSRVNQSSSITHTETESKEQCIEEPVPEIKNPIISLRLMLVENNQLEEPEFCASPKVDSNILNKSPLDAKKPSESLKFFVPEKESVNDKIDPIRSSLQSSKVNPIESLAASLHRGLQIIEYHQQNSAPKRSPDVLSSEHLALTSYHPGMKEVSTAFLCSACKKQATNNEKRVENCGPAAIEETLEGGIDASEVVRTRNAKLEALCAEQAAKIKDLDSQIDQYISVCKQSSSSQQNLSVPIKNLTEEKASCLAIENESDQQVREYKHEISLTCGEKEALLEEIQCLRMQLKSYTSSSMNDSLLEQIRNGSTQEKRDEHEIEKERWLESESRWISLTEELSMDLESNRRLAEKKQLELSIEKQSTAELDDALHRSMQVHGRMIEHYAELQEKYDELLAKHRKVMAGIAEVKKAAEKAGSKRKGSAFAAALAAELADSRIERQREGAFLKEQNRVLKLQIRDTAEAVHAAGELLVRLKEAEEAVSATEEKYGQAQQEAERLRRQVEKMKRKHTMEIATMKQYLAGSRLPESALEPLYRLPPESASEPIYGHVSESVDRGGAPPPEDDMSWRSAFRPCYR
ncbi:Kinesin-like protein KIN12B [Platanthera guangdongensis]|uniref:Kinesin-like protein KIN12B n=1 Tax=Platanthera guangdongensis TaxID=2320717 RepID=A0ABR2N277_9ASPA